MSQSRFSSVVFVRLLILFAFLAQTSAILAEDFSRPETGALFQRIGQSKANQASGLRLGIAEINDAYSRIDRHDADDALVLDLVQLKHALVEWRESTSRHLVRRGLFGTTEEFKSSVAQLNQLGGYLKDVDGIRLVQRYRLMSVAQREDPEFQTNLFNLLAEFGAPPGNKNLLSDIGFFAEPKTAAGVDALRAADWRAGPGLHFETQPIHGRSFRERVLYQPGLTDFEFLDDETVRYRGITWKSGRSILLLDLNVHFDGINTCFSVPRSCFTHNAHFVVLKIEGRRVPGFFEIYETGTRFVPMENYLARHYVAYGEVYELPEIENIDAKMGGEVRFRLKPENQMGYDFSATTVTDDGELLPGETTAVCSTLTKLGLASVGVHLGKQTDKIHPGVKQTLDRLRGLPKDSYYTPTSIMRSPLLTYAGTVDNALFFENVTRELAIGSPDAPGSLGHFLTQYDLNYETLNASIPYNLFRWLVAKAIEKIEAGKVSDKVRWRDYPIGSLVEAILGYQDRTFPRASSDALALIVYLQKFKVGPAIKSLRKALCSTALAHEAEAFLLQRAEVEVRGKLAESMNKKGIPKLFRRR